MSERAFIDDALKCPTCGRRISSDGTLWPFLTKWYCTEKCVRIAAGWKQRS